MLPPLAAASLVVASAAFAQTERARDDVAMPVAGKLLWGSDIAIENRPCCEGTGRADEREAAVLAAVEGRAGRQGRILRLRLGAGRTLRFVDCESSSACGVENVRVHRLAGWWPGRGYYVVGVSGFAEQMGYLVRQRDGLIVRTLAPPVLSPGERHAIATDLLMPRGAGATEVLDTSVDPPVRLPFAKSTSCPTLLAAGSLPRWIDDDNARFDDAMVATDEPKPKELSLHLAGGAAEWVCRY
ncbi:MAG TPA: hypothetical protein VFB13_20880 [Reyranella sp.]|nr:hypothetical protein [Reyranella sp.]